MEKYLTPSLGKYLVVKDSLQFLGSSRATLVKNLLKTGLESFKHLSRQFLGTEALGIPSNRAEAGVSV